MFERKQKKTNRSFFFLGRTTVILDVLLSCKNVGNKLMICNHNIKLTLFIINGWSLE